ncbi:MAG: hypothetical protein LUG56_03085, partial [Lachnospiraceae bacterium]|nr:hypothetical protein [Lachnospiraceae bacterium]
MKNRYGRLKRNTILRALLVSVLIVAAGYGVLTFLTQGIGQETFQSLVIQILERMGVSSDRAASLYTRLALDGKWLFAFGMLAFLFLIFFLLAVGKMTKSLNRISNALDKILSESGEPVALGE